LGVTNFIWDELSDNVQMETDENNVPTVVYTHRPERFGELISQERSGVTSYYHYDGQHSTRLLTDDSGAITDTYIFSAFGELVARTGTTTNPFGYKGAVGYYTNTATNDIYVRARTYEPVTGRWLSMDPMGSVDGPNLYRACFVPSGVDPYGLYQVSVQVDAFIPYDWVMVDPWSDLAGDDRKVSSTPLGPEASRAFTKLILEGEKCVKDDPLISEFSTISDSTMRIINTTTGYYRHITKRGTFKATVTATRTGNCSFQVNLKMHAKVPWDKFLMPPAPAIDWDFTFDVHVFELVGVGMAIDYAIDGIHDGFPAYESYIQDELVYSHDPIAQNQWIFSLFPPMEFTASAVGRLWKPGKASCCECKGTKDDLFESLHDWDKGLYSR